MRFKQIDSEVSLSDKGEGESEAKVKLGKIDVDKTDPTKMVFTKVLDMLTKNLSVKHDMAK